MSLMNRIVHVKFLEFAKKKNDFTGERFFKLARILLFTNPCERLARILIKTWLKSLDAWSLRFLTGSTSLQSCAMLLVVHQLVK